MKKNLSILLLSLFLFLPFISHGAGLAAPDCGSNMTLKAGVCVPNASGSGILASGNAVELATEIFKILLYLAGVIAVLFVIVGGYQYLTSGGNEEAAEKGKKTVTNALIGLVVIILAFTIVNVLAGTIGSGSTNYPTISN